MEVKMPPSMLNNLMYGLMKEARRSSFMDFIENWDISYEQYQNIVEWFKQFDIEIDK